MFTPVYDGETLGRPLSLGLTTIIVKWDLRTSFKNRHDANNFLSTENQMDVTDFEAVQMRSTSLSNEAAKHRISVKPKTKRSSAKIKKREVIKTWKYTLSWQDPFEFNEQLGNYCKWKEHNFYVDGSERIIWAKCFYC